MNIDISGDDFVNEEICRDEGEDFHDDLHDSESYNSDETDDECSEGEEDDSEKQRIRYDVMDSPCGNHKLCRPIVPKEFMPDLDASYESEAAGIHMYELYGDKAGFDTRLNTVSRFKDDNTVNIRYVICSRAGKIPEKSKNTLDKKGSQKERNKTFKVTDCKARIKFQRIGRTKKFKIRGFDEWHNHELDSPEDRKHSKRARKMMFTDKHFILRSLAVKLGPNKAHKLRASLEGGYENMGPEVSDYKIFKRKVGNIIGDRDAQLVVNKMLDRENELPNYTFEFDVVDSELHCMFWADETDKAYYKEFGDVISFDATFRTNKYGMRFVPFTAIDHHKKNITIGAGLISDESIQSYVWLLEAFLKAHNKQPTVVLTDQHAAVLQAVEQVFPDSRHRWCMWHITEKLPKKVSGTILQTTNFRKRFHDLVWEESIEPEDFEKEWKSLIKEYKLSKKRWFIKMYRDRMYWLPAYYKDLPMTGLMKTTSRSESSNSFFDKYTDNAHFLVYFMMNFDVAIAKQRNNQRDMEHGTKIATYEFKIPTGIERHAAKVYTKTMFLEVRKELHEGAFYCTIDSMETVNGVQVVTVSHLDKIKQKMTKCTVDLKLPEIDISCTCQHFTHEGFLCRHIFRVLINNRIEEIPEKYILRRWRKDVIYNHLLVSRHGCVETQDSTFRLINEAYNNIECCVDLVKDSKEGLLAFVESTRTKLKELEKSYTRKGRKGNDTELVTRMLEIRTIPDKIDIKAPKTRCNGTKRRIRNAAEKGASSKKKKSRRCKGCNEYAGHNWRTCQVRIARDGDSIGGDEDGDSSDN